MICTMVLYITIGAQVERVAIKREHLQETSDRQLLVLYGLTCFVYTIQLPYYSYVFFVLMFSSRLDESVSILWSSVVALVISHAALFVVEIAIRTQNVYNKVCLVVSSLLSG